MKYLVDVGKFHRKFGLDCLQTGGIGPREVPEELREFRRKFLREELAEIEEALDAGDTAKLLDGLVDLVYVALGTAHVYGLPFDEAWDEVQRANMSKERAERKEQSLRGSTYDVIKPEGWMPPDVAGILSRHGWSL